MNPILAITLNPSIDKTVCVDRLIVGNELRALSVRSIPGGKGVNLARALLSFNIPVTSLTLLDLVPSLIMRVNTTAVDLSGRHLRLLEPGNPIPGKEWIRVRRELEARLSQYSMVALCGSLPAGAPLDIYACLARASRRKGVQVILDTSGVPLQKAVHAGLWLAKPNREEAEALLGFKINSTRAVRKALQMMHGYGMTNVVLSMGQDGLAGFDGIEMALVHPPEIASGLSTGCGDAALAGFVKAVASKSGFVDALAFAAAAGAANVGLEVPGCLNMKKVLALYAKTRTEKM